MLPLLANRSEQSIEYKHANISAVLNDLRFPSILGYKPRFNYQGLLYEIVSERLASNTQLHALAVADVDRPIVVPEVEDILKVLTAPPESRSDAYTARERGALRIGHSANYLERESQNRSLGAAGEQFVLNFERARLIDCGRETLAAKIEHISRTQGDGAGFDILSFEASGAERMIEVKTTKYSRETPFFVSRNEVAVSETRASHYHLYRLFGFREAPRLFTLHGALSFTCRLSASTYLATVQ